MTSRPLSAVSAALALLALRGEAMGQTFNWNGAAEAFPTEVWSGAGNWSPSGPPTIGSAVNVDRLNLPFGTGPVLDVDVSLSNLHASNGGFIGSFETGTFGNNRHSLTVSGNTTLGPGFGFLGAPDGTTYTLGTFLNQSNGTLLYGAVLGAGNNLAPGPGPAIIQWRGANIVRNEASIGLGPQGVLRDQDTGQDALRNFNQNAGGFGVSGSYVTPGEFSNFGLLTVGTNSSYQTLARLQIGGTFVNFDAATGVLNGGSISVKGRYGGRAEFAFPGADIRTLAPFTTLELVGDAAILDSVTGQNGLRNLGELGGDFSVANALGITPSNGVLRHVNGALDVLSNGFITVTGDFQQFTGAATRIGQNASGPARLTVTGNVTIADEVSFEGLGDGSSADSFLDADQAALQIDAMLRGNGTFNFSLLTSSGLIFPGTPPVVGAPSQARAARAARVRAAAQERAFMVAALFRDPGVSLAKPPLVEAAASVTVAPGLLRLSGTVIFTADSRLGVAVTGLTPGSGYSVLAQVGAGGLALDGTLAVTLSDTFTPAAGDVFVIATSDQLSGVFSNVTDGGRIATTDGRGSFRAFYLYGPDGNTVSLTDFELSTATIFVGQFPNDSQTWGELLNWNNGVPGTVVQNVVIPSGYATNSSTDFPGLNTLIIRSASSHTLTAPSRLEFTGGITMEADGSGSSSLAFAGPGTGFLATDSLTLRSTATAGNPDIVSYLNAGLNLIQPGTAPAPMKISIPARGYFPIQASITPFRGSTLTFEMQVNSTTVSGSQFLLQGAIGEALPASPSAVGASVVYDGGGLAEVTGANTYSGGTTVRNSILPFPGGGFILSGGLYAESLTGSSTGSGPVTVTSTAATGPSGDSVGILAGNGQIAGNVTITGGYFLPGNALTTNGNPVGTITLGGSLTMANGPASNGPTASALLIDIDPRSASPSLRTDLIRLTSPAAQVNLTAVGLGLFLKSPPLPGEVFRFIDAPNAGSAISGTFKGLPQGATVSTIYASTSFDFVVTYGSNFVQLGHATPPPISYNYLRNFYFTENELSNPARSGAFADYNGDGIANILAYALGADPKNFPSGRLPRASTRTVGSGTTYSVMEIHRAIPLRPDLAYFVAESTNLTTGFGTPFDLDAAANASRILSRTDNADGTETIVVRASNPVSVTPQVFLRFSVNYTP